MVVLQFLYCWLVVSKMYCFPQALNGMIISSWIWSSRLAQILSVFFFSTTADIWRGQYRLGHVGEVQWQVLPHSEMWWQQQHGATGCHCLYQEHHNTGAQGEQNWSANLRFWMILSKILVMWSGGSGSNLDRLPDHLVDVEQIWMLFQTRVNHLTFWKIFQPCPYLDLI